MAVDLTLRMYEQSEKAAADLKKQGFRVANKPVQDRIPSLPKDITSLGDEALMDLFVSITSWVDYLSVQVSCAQIDERSAQRTFDYAESVALVSGWTGGRDSTVTLAKAKRDSDPEVMRLREELDDKHAYRKLIETMATNLERDAALVSRELTRRTAAPTPSRRAGKYF